MKALGRIFLTGVLTVLPVVATLYLMLWMFGSIEEFFGDQLKRLIDDESYHAGMGIVIAFLFVFAAGLAMQMLVVRRLVGLVERLVFEIPLVRSLYGALKDLLGLFASQDRAGLMQVVSVTLPGTEMRVLGFVTRTDFADLPAGVARPGEVAVYLPMSYQVGGYTVFLPRTQLTPVPMSREETLKFVLTAGLKTRA